MRCAAAGSELLDTRAAAAEVADRLAAQEAFGSVVILLFGTFHHRAVFDEACSFVRHKIKPNALLGTTVESCHVHGPSKEAAPSLVAFAILGKEIQANAWKSTPEDPIRISKPELVPNQIGLSDSSKMIFFLGDPFTTPITRLLPSLESAAPSCLLVGGMASGASQPGSNVLICNDSVQNAGGIGVTLAGDFDVDAVVSQGVSPIGRPSLVTGVRGNQLLALDGRSAVEVLYEAGQGVPEEAIRSFSTTPLIGTACDPTKKPLGRGDFVIRNILGIRKEEGILIVGDLPQEGDVVQFYFRDAKTARQDFQMLLDGQSLSGVPAGALLITCNGRSKRFFGEPAHDMCILQNRMAGLPLIGFAAAGEIAPLGGKVRMHGHTAVGVFFRSRRLWE